MEPANDDLLVSLSDAVVLVEEVRRLRTELAKCEMKLAELDALAHVDPLVQLANRRSFLGSVERAIARVQRTGCNIGLIFVDVDGLKAINDCLGHSAGDEALVQVAQLLVDSVRKADLVGRLAGDEFGILLENADELAAWQTALRVVEAIDDCEFCVGQVCVPLSVAVGVATVRPVDTAASVLARADKEMYRIKAIGPRLASIPTAREP